MIFLLVTFFKKNAPVTLSAAPLVVPAGFFLTVFASRFEFLRLISDGDTTWGCNIDLVDLTFKL